MKVMNIKWESMYFKYLNFNKLIRIIHSKTKTVIYVLVKNKHYIYWEKSKLISYFDNTCNFHNIIEMI